MRLVEMKKNIYIYILVSSLKTLGALAKAGQVYISCKEIRVNWPHISNIPENSDLPLLWKAQKSRKDSLLEDAWDTQWQEAQRLGGWEPDLTEPTQGSLRRTQGFEVKQETPWLLGSIKKQRVGGSKAQGETLTPCTRVWVRLLSAFPDCMQFRLSPELRSALQVEPLCWAAGCKTQCTVQIFSLKYCIPDFCSWR